MKKAVLSMRSQINAYGKQIDVIEVDYCRFLAGKFLLYPVVNYSPDLDGLLEQIRPDLIVLTGGEDVDESKLYTNANKAINREQVEELLIKYGLKNTVPILGICRGMQFLNLFLGGSSKLVQGHVLGENGHSINVIDSPYNFSFERERYIVNSFHSMGIPYDGLASDLKPFALDEHIIEAFYCQKHWIIGVQWHPERGGCDKLNQEILRMINQ